MKKYIEKKIIALENNQAFNPSWYGILVNPFYITRRELYQKIKTFSETCGQGLEILDVGCGIKPYAKLFSNHHYLGIDVAGGGLDDQTKKPDLFFDGQNLPFSEDKFDLVIATEVFEHVQYLPELTKEIYRVLKPNGKLFITMPFIWPEHGLPYDFRRLTSFGHQQLLKSSGFINIKSQATTGVFGTCGQLISDFIITNYFEFLNKISSTGWGYKLKFISIRLVVFLFCFPCQLIFLLLDRVFKKRGATLDLIVTAEKI